MRYYLTDGGAVYGIENIEYAPKKAKEISYKKAMEIVDSPPILEEIISDAEYKKQNLLSEAAAQIEILSDAVEYASDLGLDAEIEALRLKSWRTYRVLLSRIDTSKAPDILWPEMPEK